MGSLLGPWAAVLTAWVLTPIGAVLTIIIIGLASYMGVMHVLGRGIGIAMFLMKITAAAWTLWVVGGILEAMGLPVKETLASLFSFLPPILHAIGRFLIQLFEAPLS
jgi:hypothetical protein